MVYSILELALPGRPTQPAGVLLLDEDSGRLGVKLRRDWDRLGEEADLDEEDAAILKGIEGEIRRKAAHEGAGQTLAWLEATLSNVFQLGGRRSLAGGEGPGGLGFEFALHRLYREWVPTVVEPFRTHLPRYALRSAAGLFSEAQGEEKNDVADWVEAPAGLRLSKDMFVAEVHGRSMEPLIPSGSLCIFRKFGAGSRQGKRVLVEDRKESASGGERYTVKVYRSEKRTAEVQEGAEARDGEGAWERVRIWLEPLNAEFPVLELEADESRYAVIAEYVGLLDA